jgi:hypothetical protein
MRIPPSVIVMSLLVAVPFGLGIRETLAQEDALEAAWGPETDGLDFDSKRSARERRRALAEYEAELAREATERELRKAERIAQLDQLFGPKPAMMGSLLDGISIGAGAGSFQPENVRRRIERATRDGFIGVSFDADAASLNAVNVEVNSDYETSDACNQLDDKLEAAWGPGTRGTWLDPATHQRATYDRETCVLRFDRYLDSGEWVAALPIQLIGSHVDKLTRQLGGAVEDSGEDFVVWRMPGLRYGKAETKLEAYVLRDKVVGFKVVFDSDFDSMLGVRDALSAKLQAQVRRDEDTGVWTWKSRLPVTLEELDSHRFALTVGKF